MFEGNPAHGPTPCLSHSADGRLELFIVGIASGADKRIAVWHKWQTAPNGGWSDWTSRGTPPGVHYQWSGPAARPSADGRIELFMTYGGDLWQTFQTAPNGGWFDWTRRGRPLPGQSDNRNSNLVGFPAVGRNADGRLQAFATGVDGTLWQTYQTAPNNGWHEWEESFGGLGMGLRPAVASNADGRMEVFAETAIDYGLFSNSQTAPNGNWAGRAPLDMPPGSEYLGLGSACAPSANGRLELFVIASDGALWQRVQTAPNGPWSAWTARGNPPGVKLRLAGGPVVGRDADGRLEVFAAGEDGALWHTWQTTPNGAWSPWASRGTPTAGVTFVGVPAVAASADGRMELFMVGSDNNLWHIWQTAPNNGWSNWSSHGAPNGYGFLTVPPHSTDIAVGSFPTFMAINEQGTRLYVSNSQATTVSVINTATNAVVATVQVGKLPQRPSLNPDESRLYVGHQDGVAVIDTATNQVVTDLPIKPFASDVAFTADGSRAYVIQSEGLVSVMDTATHTVLATVKAGNGDGTRVVIRPDGKRIYTTNENGISVIDTTTNTLLAKFPLAGKNDGPQDLAISANGTRIYATIQIEGTMRVIDTADLNTIATIPLIYGTLSMALNKTGTRALTTNPGSYTTGGHPFTFNVLSMVDITTNAVTGTLDVGSFPADVVFSPDGTRAYITRFTDNVVSVVELPQGF